MQYAIIGTVRMAVAAAALALGALAAQAQDALATVQGYMAAWNAHDSAKAAAFFADDVSYFDASVGEAIKGREEAKKGVIDNFLTAVPDAKWTVVGEPLVSGDKVAFEWTFAGTNTGAWGDGTAATGKTFTLTGASMFTVRGGKIVAQSDYYDALGFYKQLGLM
jgi:steroid delta-isomerase-like uncharacterized protein